MKYVVKRYFRHENAVLIGILAVIAIVLAVITNGLTATTSNVRNLLLISSARGVAAIGQGFCILSGNFDLSVGGIALVTSVLGATLMTTNINQNIIGYPMIPGLAILLMLLTGLGIGVINGLSVSRIGMPALIVTLAMWQMTRGMAYRIGRGWTIFELPRTLAFFGQGIVGGVPVPIIIFIASAITAYFILNHTTFGRSVYMTGGSPVSAWLSGINVRNVQLSVYIISGSLAALAGLVIIGLTMSVSMANATGLELDSIAAVVLGGVSLLGGRGSLIGIVIGVLIMGAINNGMGVMGIHPSIQDFMKGVVIFTAVAVDAQRRKYH